MREPKRGQGRGFTLIELLIVVAIIGILAAIAIPNFLQAQIRAKVSRVHAEFQMLATALESYYVDNNTYPLVGVMQGAYGWELDDVGYPLRTPIVYITVYPLDPFRRNDGGWCTYWSGHYIYNKYWPVDLGAPPPGHGGNDFTQNPEIKWGLMSYGPDRATQNAPWPSVGVYAPQASWTPEKVVVNYDPKNGIISTGDICRFGPGR